MPPHAPVSRTIFPDKILPSILVSISVTVLQPFFFRYPHEMLGADVAERGGLAFLGVVEAEAAFVHHAAGLRVSVIVAAPYCRHAQIFETTLRPCPQYGLPIQ